MTGEDLTSLEPKGETALTVGVFDGVHMGHRHLLSVLTKQAKENDLLSGVITFRQHPLSLLKPDINLPLLTNLPQRIKLIKSEAVDFVIAINFTLEMAQTSAADFIGLLKRNMKMKSLVLGQDFVLGRNQEGNADALTALSRDMDFRLTVVPHLKMDGEVVSSTAIRKALAGGNIKKANRMLGRCYSLDGRVIVGSGRGTDIGFPTANIDIEPQQALPIDGVYATRALVDGRSYNSVTNIGNCPTFKKDEKTIEIHIVDYEGDLYRSEIKIDIIDRLRGEKCFNSREALKDQISNDIGQAISILGSMDK